MASSLRIPRQMRPIVSRSPGVLKGFKIFWRVVYYTFVLEGSKVRFRRLWKDGLVGAHSPAHVSDRVPVA